MIGKKALETCRNCPPRCSPCTTGPRVSDPLTRYGSDRWVRRRTTHRGS